MKLAAIDIGTNSIRTIIADIHGNGTFQVIDQLKDMVRLGEGENPETGLTPRAMADGLAALIKAKAICDAHQVERIIAVATSAVREAKNGGTFVERVEQETGIVVNVITGEEEARLIYLGARESIDFANRRVLIVEPTGRIGLVNTQSTSTVASSALRIRLSKTYWRSIRSPVTIGRSSAKSASIRRPPRRASRLRLRST